VEDIEIPLVEDDTFREFDRLIHIPPDSMVHARIVGRFFAGRKDRLIHPDTWGGYGHMGCCSLLAIQQIESVDSRERDDLDYRASPDQPAEKEAKCGYQDLVPIEPYAENMSAQNRAEQNGQESAFKDPRGVAEDFLIKTAGIDRMAVTALKEERSAPGRVVYKLRHRVDKTTYIVVVSRPYWLSFYSRDSARVAWVVIAAYKIPCKV
jgi:hypothetical protein